MYCTQCGTEIFAKDDFCKGCGLHLTKSKPATTNSASSSQSVATVNTGKKLDSFKEFWKNKKSKKSKVEQEEDVKIHVSLLHEKGGVFRQVSGSRTPVFVKPNDEYNSVKTAAYEKLSRYVEEMREYQSKHELDLCYRNGNLAVSLPDTIQDFTVKGYKEDLGCKYFHIVLYLKAAELSNEILLIHQTTAII